LSSVRGLASAQPYGQEPSVHSEAFCENLYELCDRITEKEQALLAAVDHGQEDRAETIRGELDGLYRQFIYL
ncbi:MAG: excinuclease ABC subunit B, partial [Rhizorhabdus sp.]|nr:excinuclease ABC subunit B [Rhizorhabdus sp.]